MKQLRRTNSGSQLSEFGAALVVLVIGFTLPLLDLAVLPLHWVLSQEIMISEARRLAESKTFSAAIDTLATDSSLATQLTKLGGVKPVSTKCILVITMLKEPYESFVADDPKSVLPEWLPGGKRAPCIYELEVSAVLELSPLVLISGFGQGIPGLTKPFVCTMTEKATWESYGRDPQTKKFYLNE